MTTSMKHHHRQDVDDQMVLISQYYPDIHTQLVPEQGFGFVCIYACTQIVWFCWLAKIEVLFQEK